jgi:hypothetical protein
MKVYQEQLLFRYPGGSTPTSIRRIEIYQKAERDI